MVSRPDHDFEATKNPGFKVLIYGHYSTFHIGRKPIAGCLFGFAASHKNKHCCDLIGENEYNLRELSAIDAALAIL